MKNIFNALFWLVLRLSGIKCTFGEVTANAYKAQEAQDYIKSLDPPSAIHLEIAKTGFERQEKRNQYVLDKAKSLMTLVGLLMSVLLATSVAGGLVTGTWLPLLMLLLSLVVLLIALIVLARLLSVGVSSEPTIDEDLAKAKTAKAESKLYFESILVATNKNWAANDFMVDVYRVANRLMVLGIALAAATVLASLYIQHAKAGITQGTSRIACPPTVTSAPPSKVTAGATKATAAPAMKIPVAVTAVVQPSKAPNQTTKK